MGTQCEVGAQQLSLLSAAPAATDFQSTPLTATAASLSRAGYEGFLGGVSAANKKVTAKPDERLFSWSSLTGQLQQQRR